MKRKLTRNLGIKFLSLLVAFVIWLIVVNVDNPTKSVLFRNVPIQVINEDSVTDIDQVFDIISAENVTIKVTERKSVLNALAKDGSDFAVIADMENLNAMGTVPLVVTCVNSAITLDEIDIVPSSMKVQLEQKKQSEFLINIAVAGVPKGYEVGKTEIVEGKTVQIAGPASMIDKIGQVVASVNLGQSHSDQKLDGSLQIFDKNGDAFKENQMSRLQIMDAAGALISDNTVSVDVTMWEVQNDITVKVSTSGVPADGYYLAAISTLPVSISLVGTEESLAALGGEILLAEPVSIENTTDNFTAELDITETLDQIEGLRLAADADPTISVSVQIEQTGDQTVLLPLSNLEVLNRPEKMNLVFSPADEITLIIHADDAGSIKVEDIQAAIDLAVCVEPGTYEIPVDVTLPEQYSLVTGATLVVSAEEYTIPENVQEEVKEE